jgi:ribosomal protein L29
MTPKELTEKTIKDIRERRRKAEREFFAYRNEQNVRKLRNWSVRVGGCRW